MDSKNTHRSRENSNASTKRVFFNAHRKWFLENILRKGATGKHIDKNAKLFFAQSSQNTHTHTHLFLQTWWPFLQNWCWFERKDLARQMATEKKWQNHKNNLCAKVCRWRIHANMIFPPFCTLKNLFLHNKRLYFALVFSVLPDNYFGNKVHQSSRKPCQQKKNVSRKRRSFRLFRNKKKKENTSLRKTWPEKQQQKKCWQNHKNDLRTKFLSLENVRTHDLGTILLFFLHMKRTWCWKVILKGNKSSVKLKPSRKRAKMPSTEKETS